jgi:hypothetical protein
MKIQNTLNMGELAFAKRRVTAQAVSRGPFPSKVRVRCQASPHGVLVDRMTVGIFFPGHFCFSL